MASIEVDGFDEIEELLADMNITQEDERKAMKKAIAPVAAEVERNTPKKTKRLEKSVAESVTKEDFATVGIVKMGEFYDIFEEFGTSQSKKNVGFFERSINNTQDGAITTLANELLK